MIKKYLRQTKKKSSATPFSLVEMVIMIRMIYGLITFRREPRVAIWLFLVYFVGNKTFYSRRDPFVNDLSCQRSSIFLIKPKEMIL